MTSKIRLNELMAIENVDENFSTSESEISIDETLQWDSLYNNMTDVNAEFLQAQSSNYLAELDVKAIQSRNYPYLRLDAGYSYAMNVYNGGGTRRRHQFGPDAGLSFGFTIFDGKRARETRNAKIAYENAGLRMQEIETALKADLSTFWQAYLNNLQLLSLERANLVSAHQNYEFARDLYVTGVMAGIELREAQKSLLDSEERLLVAQYNTKMCEISLMQISGRALDYTDRRP
jgi:outer membrane protein TolC